MQVFNSSGMFLHCFGPGFLSPTGVVVQPNGELVICDFDGFKFHAVRPNGDHINMIGAGPFFSKTALGNILLS